MRKWTVILVFVVLSGAVLAVVVASANIKNKNFFDCFGVVYSPTASEQPQVQFAVLHRLLQLRSLYKKLAEYEIILIKAVEADRDSIADRGPNVARQKELAGMLKEYKNLPEQKKKLFLAYFNACKLAREKDFNESADLAGCYFSSAIDTSELCNQMTALQMK